MNQDNNQHGRLGLKLNEFGVVEGEEGVRVVDTPYSGYGELHQTERGREFPCRET